MEKGKLFIYSTKLYGGYANDTVNSIISGERYVQEGKGGERLTSEMC